MEKNALEAILHEIEAKQKEQNGDFLFAVFDYDNTLVENDLQQAFITYLCRHRLLRDKTLLHDTALAQNEEAYHDAFFTHYWTLLSQGVTKDAFTFLLRALSGYREDEIDALVASIIQEQGTLLGSEQHLGFTITKGFRLREKVRELMIACKERGIAPYVITASPEALVRSALAYYDIPATSCIGINAECSNGIFSSRLVEPMPVEEGKITCIQKFIHKTAPLLGVGDSMNDYGMLQHSTIRVVIDRNNELTSLAHENKWHVLQA